MKWIKDVIVDLMTTAAIVFAGFLETKWLVALVVGYTALVLLLRLSLSFNKSMKLPKKLSTQVPDWFYHAIYGFNSAFLLYQQWWITGFAWAGIWFLAWRSKSPQWYSRTYFEPNSYPKRNTSLRMDSKIRCGMVNFQTAEIYHPTSVTYFLLELPKNETVYWCFR